MANTTEYYASKANLSSILTKVNTKLSNRYTKAEADAAIASAIGGVTQFDYQIVNELPSTGTKGVIYLVSNSGTTPNLYDEYIWITVSDTGSFEKIGWKDLDTSAFLVGADVKVDGTTITKTPDQSGNGFTLSAAAATTVSDGTGIDVTHSGNDYEVALDTATQTSLGKADTAVQKADIKGTTDEVTVTADVSGNGVTISLDADIVSGAAAGATALQPGDIEPLSSSDVDDLLALITDDPSSSTP